MTFSVRAARTSDMRAIVRLVSGYAEERILLHKETVAYYEDVQDFQVAVDDTDGTLVGCGALHIMWEDLAEVRTLAVRPEWRGRGVGSALLHVLLQQAKETGVSRLFCLTFEIDF